MGKKDKVQEEKRDLNDKSEKVEQDEIENPDEQNLKGSETATDKNPDDDTSTEYIQSLQKELAELKMQVEQLKDALLRKAAEFENFKRRNENDQFNLIKYKS